CGGDTLALAGVHRERDPQTRVTDQFAQTPKLIVSEGVHRIKQDGLRTFDAIRPQLQNSGEEREQEGLGLAAACARLDDGIAPKRLHPPQYVLLVKVKLIVSEAPFQPQQVFVADAFITKLPQGVLPG